MLTLLSVSYLLYALVSWLVLPSKTQHDEHVYTGEYSEAGNYHGKGQIVTKQGDYFEGNFNDGKIEGYGEWFRATSQSRVRRRIECLMLDSRYILPGARFLAARTQIGPLTSIRAFCCGSTYRSRASLKMVRLSQGVRCAQMAPGMKGISMAVASLRSGHIYQVLHSLERTLEDLRTDTGMDQLASTITLARSLKALTKRAYEMVLVY